MHFGGDQHYYETRMKQEHAHVICLRCGKVEEFYGEPLQKLRRQVETHFGFQVLIRAHRGGRLLRALPGAAGCRSSRSLRPTPAPRLPVRKRNKRWRMMPHDGTRFRTEHRTATLVVVNPNGQPLAGLAGSAAVHASAGTPDNHLVLRDNRASRNHARIVCENGEYYRGGPQAAATASTSTASASRGSSWHHADRIEFGFHGLLHTGVHARGARNPDAVEQPRRHPAGGRRAPAPGTWPSCAPWWRWPARSRTRFRPTTCWRRWWTRRWPSPAPNAVSCCCDSGDELDLAVARDRKGQRACRQRPAGAHRGVIDRALTQRRELLSMNFDPRGVRESDRTRSVADLELRSVVCVPLVRVRGNSSEDTQHDLDGQSDTVGVLYLDSRVGAADLSTGNRELLQTLAIEASTILENARLLEEERAKQRMEEELNVAREIQASLLPRSLPVDGWFRAAGSSMPSHQVGGDYFDVKQLATGPVVAVVADVSGKGVSSALLAALLQGAFLLASESLEMDQMMSRVNLFLHERTEGEKYATVFYCTVERGGRLRLGERGPSDAAAVADEWRYPAVGEHRLSGRAASGGQLHGGNSATGTGRQTPRV